MDDKPSIDELTAREEPNSFASSTLNYLFPFPVMYFDWPQTAIFDIRLKDIILEMRARSAGVVKTNRGGWQSDTDLDSWEYSEIKILKTRIFELVREYVRRTLGATGSDYVDGWSMRAWANVNQHGHFNRTHDHVGRYSFFSGIYYVDVGDIDEHGHGDGFTVFEDWSYVATGIQHDPNPLQRDFKVLPKNGRMVIFPASLMHSVERYTGTKPRITIAFNLHHPAFAVPRLRHRELAESWMHKNFRGIAILGRKIPEKLYGLALIPRLLAANPVPKPLTVRGLWGLASATVHHALALASERFENRGGV